MGMGDQRHALAALPPGKSPVIYYIWGWVVPRAGPEKKKNLLPLRGFELRTVQPLASPYKLKSCPTANFLTETHTRRSLG